MNAIGERVRGITGSTDGIVGRLRQAQRRCRFVWPRFCGLASAAYFVAATTYGSEAMALSAIRRVNTIHANIRGIDLLGQPYVANEPELIRWVHLVEVTSFLAAYQHLAKRPLSPQACDQYIREMARVGHLF